MAWTTGHYSRDERLSTFSYWKSQYERKTRDIGFDWFLDSKGVLATILENMEQICLPGGLSSSILQIGHSNSCVAEEAKRTSVSYLDLGCGTSSLSFEVFKNWPHSMLQVLLDFVPEALTYQMAKWTKSRPTREDKTCIGVCADVQKLPFASDSFNFIVDKGTMDALLKDRNHGHCKSKLMLSEVMRVLAPGGRYLQISDEDPDSRLLYLEQICSRCLEHPEHQSLTAYSPLPHSDISNDGMLNFILPQGRLLDQSDLMKYHLKILHSSHQVRSDQTSTAIFNQDETRQKNHNYLSSWSFKVLSSPSDIEYFVYWANKNV